MEKADLKTERGLTLFGVQYPVTSFMRLVEVKRSTNSAEKIFAKSGNIFD